jgi:hypothetical protein
MSIVVSLTVVTDDPEHATRAAEAMARVATGLVLDRINVSLSLGVAEDEEETDGG